jgi:hypothetical protein
MWLFDVKKVLTDIFSMSNKNMKAAFGVIRGYFNEKSQTSRPAISILI